MGSGFRVWGLISPVYTAREQLKRIKSFLGLEITKSYHDSKGKKRCVLGTCRFPRPCPLMWMLGVDSAAHTKAGGAHLKQSQCYPGLFALKAAGSQLG